MFCACTGGPVCGSLLEFWLIYIYTFIVYNYLYDILNDIIIIVIYSSWTLRIVLHPDTKEMNVWHFEMLNASGHVQYVVENISGCLGCMGVDRWPCQVLCHRMSEVIVVEFCIHVLHGLRVPSVALAFLCMFFFDTFCVYTIYIYYMYIHTYISTYTWSPHNPDNQARYVAPYSCQPLQVFQVSRCQRFSGEYFASRSCGDWACLQ